MFVFSAIDIILIYPKRVNSDTIIHFKRILRLKEEKTCQIEVDAVSVNMLNFAYLQIPSLRSLEQF